MSEGIKKVNGIASESTEESTSECLMDTGVSSLSIDKDSKDTFSDELSFQLCITNDRGMSCKPISEDLVIKPTKLVKVFLYWTDKDHDSYDANYLKDLRIGHKPEISVKKTKQESISLFSCLDAFLKEEPLGPDDMWYCPGCKEHRQATKKLDLWRLPDSIL